jgi:hypothetical protein
VVDLEDFCSREGRRPELSDLEAGIAQLEAGISQLEDIEAAILN